MAAKKTGKKKVSKKAAAKKSARKTATKKRVKTRNEKPATREVLAKKVTACEVEPLFPSQASAPDELPAGLDILAQATAAVRNLVVEAATEAVRIAGQVTALALGKENPRPKTTRRKRRP